jgi:hypothetical protein
MLKPSWEEFLVCRPVACSSERNLYLKRPSSSEQWQPSFRPSFASERALQLLVIARSSRHHAILGRIQLKLERR